MAKIGEFSHFDKFFDKICTFSRTKNGTLAAKIL